MNYANPIPTLVRAGRVAFALEVIGICCCVFGIATPFIAAIAFGNPLPAFTLGLLWGVPTFLCFWGFAAILRLLARITVAAETIASGKASQDMLAALNVLADEGRERKRLRDEEAKRQRIAEAEQRMAQ